MSQDSGAWLVVRTQSVGSDACDRIALPVPRQVCLGLARAVLAGCDDPARWLSLAGGDAAVRAWLDAAAAGPVDGFFRATMPAAAARAGLLNRLAESLVVGVPPAGAGQVLPAQEPSLEAVILADVVERMQAYERLAADFAAELQTARLEAARELAYGAGHEINNPLANIATRAQALLLEEHDGERRRRLATIVDQSFRARDMIGGLMLFARPPKPQVGEADAVDLLGGVIESIRPLAAARGVRLEVGRFAGPLRIAVDRSQIEEAVRAIATNAIEAVAEGGRVILKVGPGAGPGQWCEITVADDGIGMDDATIRRAFDPFFSGREAGRGAGLGLSKAWRFIEGHGGTVAIASRPGAGTTVEVRLPTIAAGKPCPASPV